MLLQPVFALTLLYFLARNRIDFLLLFFLSTTLYSWQIIYGIIWVPPYTFPASQESKIIVLILLFVLILFTILNDLILKNKKDLPYSRAGEGDAVFFFTTLTFISYLSCLIAVLNIGPEILSISKKSFVAKSGLPFFFLLYYPAAMACLFFVTSRRYKLAFYSAVPLIFYIFVGFRAAAVITFITGFFIFYYNQKIFNLKLYKPILLVIIVFAFFVLYKFTYIGLKLGDLSTIATILEKDPRFSNLPEFLAYAFFSAEFGQAASNLSITSSMDLSDSYSFRDAFVGSIPLVDFITGISEEESRFSTIIESYANPGFSYGLGSSIWGEIFQAGGYSGVIIFSILIIFTIFQFNLSFRRSKNKFVLFSFFIGFLSFYIHRNDFVLLTGHIKNIVIITTLGLCVLWLIKNRVYLLPFSKAR
tara:strand:- start:6307 stop:7560 length:1254 start_codon:yes stop_codon:yes gene_type:complete